MGTRSTNRDETIKLLIQVAMGATTIAPLVALLLLGGIAASQLSGGAATLVVLLMLGGVVAVITATLVIHRALQRRARNRFLALVDVCRDYAGGNRTVRAQVVGDDDFALLAMALNTLLDSQGLSDLEQEQEVKSQQDYQLSALQVQVERLLHEVGCVSQGSLPLESGVSAEALGMLADSFAYLVEALAQATRQIHLATVQTTQTARNALVYNEQLGQESAEHLRQLGQVTGSVEGLAVFAQQVARTVRLGVEAAEGALESATLGKSAVNQAIESMADVQMRTQETAQAINALAATSREIGEGMQTLSDIVEHLGLLARNAQLLDAFSSEQGQAKAGWAEDLGLVARRARATYSLLDGLAGKLQQAGRAAASAIETSTQEAGRSAHLTASAGRALSTLALELSQQAHVLAQFTQEAEAQAPSAQALAERTGQLVEEMAEGHARRQDALGAIHQLSSLAAQLRTFVSTIQVPDVPLIEEETLREGMSNPEQSGIR